MTPTIDVIETKPLGESSLDDDQPMLALHRGPGPAGSVVHQAQKAEIFGALFGEPTLRRFGRYIVLDVLGQGAMGVVLKGYDDELDRQVAIKVLHADPAGLQGPRLRREAQALAQLAHPNVVQVYEVGEAEEQRFVAMELVKGQTLRQWQGDPGSPRPWKECVQVYLQAGRGLAAAHQKGLVHRDFKPGNAILDEEGRARVLDFGLARRGDDSRSDDTGDAPTVLQRARTVEQQAVPLDQSLTQTGMVLGTPAYMPTEQMMGQEADARSDQFSFCVALYEAVYGERPYEGSSMAELMASMQRNAVRPVPKGSRVSAALRKVLLRGLANDPNERWPSMEALLEQLQRLVAPRAHRWGAGVGVALAVAAGLAALWQSDELSATQEQLTDREAQLAQRVEELKLEKRRTNAQLHVQMGMRATMLADSQGHELEAVALAIEAFDGLDPQAGPVPATVFEGLTHALAGVHRGIALRGHEGDVYAVAVSPDGQRIATASDDQTVRLWDAHSGAALRTLEGHTGTIWGVAFSPHGARLATASEDHTVRIWDGVSGTLLDSLRHQQPVRSVAFSPDGTRIATAAAELAWVWHGDVDAMMPLVGHTGRVRGVAFSPHGEWLVTGSEDHTVRLWDAQTGAPLRTLTGHTDEVYAVAVSPDGTRIATGGRDQTARVWEAATGEPVATLAPGEVVYAVAFSPDGTHLATGTWDDSAAHLWDLATDRRLQAFNHDDAVFGVAFSPDGHRLVTASRDFTAHSWDVVPGDLDPAGALTTLPHPRRVDAVAISPDGTHMATGGRDGSARVWDASSGAHLATLQGHALDVLAVAFSADGTHLATASWDGSVRVWLADSGALVQTFADHTEPVRAVVFSPDGTRVATASRDGTARVWDVSTGEPQHALSHGSPVVDAVFSPDGQRLVTLGNDGTLRVWSPTTGEALTTFVPEGLVTAVALSPDGTRIAAALEDYAVRTWSVNSGEELATLRGHAAPVRTVAFSADGQQLATGGEDGTARVWDATTGDPRTTLPHEGPVGRVAFSADGHTLATASGDAMARLWSLAPRAWRTWGCAVLASRQGHTEITRAACPKVTTVAVTPKAQPSLPAEPLVSAPEATRPAPEVITVHGVDLVLIPGGTFTMGSPPGEHGRRDDEGPQHEVTLESFYLARTEVTNAQYALYLEANPEAPKPTDPGERANRPDQPIVGLTWYEAKAYCDWAGLVLPTEAQWEYAARAGTTTAYWFGDDAEDLERFDWFSANTGASTRSAVHGRAHSVGTKGANPWGLFDMHGNVWEWTLDADAPYTAGVRAGDGSRKQPAGDAFRIMRSGCWYHGAANARSAARLIWRPDDRNSLLGFRPARSQH